MFDLFFVAALATLVFLTSQVSVGWVVFWNLVGLWCYLVMDAQQQMGDNL